MTCTFWIVVLTPHPGRKGSSFVFIPKVIQNKLFFKTKTAVMLSHLYFKLLSLTKHILQGTTYDTSLEVLLPASLLYVSVDKIVLKLHLGMMRRYTSI